ncbi:site-2 protease family protein [Paenibacillus urinalis]|uniref:Site-2 protease family protein n=1 Tax=Paenibacillus urinalis TaxID=521520 RepID=A0AAX3MVF8_9BACL|nr:MULTISPECIES: site-2 protease family protein [Paenibacillus]WDH81591.1 site-2 protease family protein [Paenibacillus urinalis]WDH97634.1 site-2 protease family protein [Paenibacillus urinalis]WDI01308.1 site-2 protease family protein [Paenibacillus urinalis]GAK39622.1 putative peptidase [Paenibacillus sp. TCA20]
MSMDQFFFYPLEQLPFFILTILIAFTVHEFAHAYFANKFGDPTAKMLGRMTLNPAVHFDFFGLLLLVIAGFGWARPIPVNRDNFDRRRMMSVVVSAAGPVSNLLLAVIGTIIYALLIQFGVMDSIENQRLVFAISTFFSIFNVTNFFLFFFNLVPLPPLDGYRIVEELVPTRIRIKLQSLEQWSILIFLIIVITPLNRWTITPLYELSMSWYTGIAQMVMTLFGG